MSEPTTYERHLAAYRVLLHLYPREFRRTYGSAMAQLFADQMRYGGHGPGRLWSRTIGDLARSVPFERLEAIMARQQFMVGLAVGFAVAVAITLVGFGFGTDLTRNPGDLVLALVIVLVAEAMIVGLAYGYRRLMTRPTEATWQRSALGHGWVLAAVAVALYYLGTTIAQFIDEPTSGNAVALAISVAWTGMIGLGLVLRARRPGSLGTWLAIVGVAPGLGVVWFIPVAVLSLLALVGALAEALGGSARHELRPS